MIDNLFSFPLIMLYALFYGLTMKIADLLDEHGLKLFPGSKIIFGLLWGFFGALLVIGNNEIANIMLAMNLAFIIRGRLDYLNHQIAASMIIITFLFFSVFEPTIFVLFYLIFLIFGSLRDWVRDLIKNKNKLQLIYDQIMWYYPVATFIYCSIYGNWIIFYTFLVYTISYDGIKYIYKQKGFN